MHVFWSDALRPCKHRVILATLHPLVSASIDGSCVDQLLWWWLPNGNFLISIIFSTFISWDSTIMKSFSNSFIYLSGVCLFMLMWTCGFWLCSTGYHLLPYWMFMLFQIWLVESLQAGSCVLVTCFHHSLRTSLLSGTRYSRLILYFVCFNSGAIFSKRLGSI